MCGIAGFNWRDEEAMKKMLEKLKHRGPDDEGIYSDKKITLGHRRLSILDLSAKGHQPMFSKDGNLIIVHNGEIYNYIELRKELEEKGYMFDSNTDTEVILYAYKEWGPECVKKFNGMWAFVIYDKNKEILFLSRDRFGIKPLYYYFDGDKFVFASEIKALLIHKEQWKPNDLAIFDYLMYNLTDHQNFTFFEGIYKLPKAHHGIFNLDTHTFTISEYWVPIAAESDVTIEDAIENLRGYLESSVLLRLRSDVPVGSCLSGGVDSSSIVAIMAKNIPNKENINTFSAVYPGFERNEEKYIDLLTERLGIKNSKISPDHKTLLEDIYEFIYYLEEPTRSTSQYSQYNVMKLAARHNYKVLLDGQGSDELLAGYPYFYSYYLYELIKNWKIKSFLEFIKKCRKSIPNKRWFHGFLFLLLPRLLKKHVLKKRTNYLSKNFIKQYFEKSMVFDEIINKKTLKDALFVHLNYKLEELLKWEDRNAMRFSIETRVPFLDYRFVEYILSLPSDYIIKDCYTKYVLRKGMEEYVPKEVIYRKDKVGFETPEAEWLRKRDVQEFVDKLITTKSFRKRKYWDAEKIEALWKEHIEGKSDNSLQLWKVIFLELWLRTFMDGVINNDERQSFI